MTFHEVSIAIYRRGSILIKPKSIITFLDASEVKSVRFYCTGKGFNNEKNDPFGHSSC